MPQFSYTYPAGQAGQIGTYATADLISVLNPLGRQTTNYDVDSTTTNGTYGLTAVGANGSTATASFVASGLSAAQIAAGVAAAILADPSFRSLVLSATVVNTDQVDIVFQQAGMVYTVTAIAGAPSGPDITTSVAAGYSTIPLGVILQSNTTGGFTTAYSDGTLALGVTAINADLVLPFDGLGPYGYSGPAEMCLVRTGEIYVQVAPTVSVDKGDLAFFNGTTQTWSNVSSGSHVAVIGAMWCTSGTGIQRVFVRLPTAAS